MRINLRQLESLVYEQHFVIIDVVGHYHIEDTANRAFNDLLNFTRQFDFELICVYARDFKKVGFVLCL